MASSGLLASLVFSPILPRPSIITAEDRKQFGEFTNRFEHVISPPLPPFYTDKKTGHSVWVAPETVLALLLANKDLDNSLRPRRWFSIPKSPLLLIFCKGGEWLLGNTINNRLTKELGSGVWRLLSPEVCTGILQEELPGTEGINRKSESLTIQEVLQGHGWKDANNIISEPEMGLLGKRTAPVDELITQDAYPTYEVSKNISVEEKRDFFAVLKEQNIPIMGDSMKAFKQLSSRSKDPRLLGVPVEKHTALIEEYLAQEKAISQAKANEGRNVISI